jgi:hypothetical protein
MQSFVRQMAQYDALAATFKSKYRNLPGDATVFGCTDSADNTCNNGAIEAFPSATEWLFALESALFWKQLSDSGFRPSGVSYTATIPVDIVIVDINVPEAEIGTAGVAVYAVSGVNYYIVSGYTNNFAINTTAGLTATDSVAFDQKVDDGLATTGNVVVGLAAANPNCNDLGAYDIVNGGSTLVCSLAVKMMSGMNF